MTEFPPCEATTLTERIMHNIRGHLKTDEPESAHHFNRTYEKVWEVLNKHFTTTGQFGFRGGLR